MIPRDRVREALREAKLDTSGYPDREDLLKVARALEADYVLMGQVAAFDQQISGVSVGFFSVQTQTATVRLRGRILDGKATLEAVEQFVARAKPHLK